MIEIKEERKGHGKKESKEIENETRGIGENERSEEMGKRTVKERKGKGK